MAMKPVFKLLAIAGVSLAANAVYAHYHWIANPYLGLEYKLSYTKGRDSWKRLLPTNKPNHNGTVFAGLKFHDCVAGELGFTKSNAYTKDSDTSGLTIFGSQEGANAKQKIKLSYRSWHLDVNGQYPAGDAFAFIGTVGVGSAKPKLEAVNLGAANNNGITTVAGKSKMLLRLGVGAQYAKGMFGVRSRVMWEGTSRLRVNPNSYRDATLPGVTEKPFKDTLAWTLGAFVRW